MPKAVKSIENNNLRYLRRLTRHSLAEMSMLLSHHTGNVIDTTTISKHESGTRNPSETELKAYAQIFKVPEVALYRDVCSQQELLRVLSESGDQWLFESALVPQDDRH